MYIYFYTPPGYGDIPGFSIAMSYFVLFAMIKFDKAEKYLVSDLQKRLLRKPPLLG